MKSKSIENVRSPCGIIEVVSPRAVTYSGTCQEWFVQGVWTSRTLPTTCVQRCSVAQVSRQSSKGSGGHTSSSMPPSTTPRPAGRQGPRALTNERLSRYQPTPMLVHLGLVQERVADQVPDREAVVWGDGVLTYADLSARSRRIASALCGLGLGCRSERRHLQPWESGQDHVALYLYNGPERIEAMYGALKARTASVNVNYRYKAEELVYVFANSDARAVIYHAAFAPTLAVIRDRLPALRNLIQVADDSGEPLLPGAVDYEVWLAGASAAPPELPYSADDLYVLYTGGTTGLP